MKATNVLLVLITTLTASFSVYAATPIADKSLLGVVTYKEGLASGFAHNHFVVAQSFQAEGDFDVANPAASKLTLTVSVNAMSIDESASYQTWLPLLKAENILEEASKLSDSDRKDIRENMLSKSQLDGEGFPTITGTLSHVSKKGEGAWNGTLDLTIRGNKVSRSVPLKVENGSETTVLINEKYNFSDFKIDAYSAMLGAIRVKNNFTLIVKLVLPASTETTGEKQ